MLKRALTATATGIALLAGGALTAAPAQAGIMDVNMVIGITNDSPHAVYVVVDWEGDSSGPSGPVSATAPPQGTNDNPWTYPKFPDGTDAFIEVDYEGSGDIKVTTKIYPDADHSFLIGTYWDTYQNGFWKFSPEGDSGTASDWIGAFNSGFGVNRFNINLPAGILDPYYGGLSSDSPVGAAADVNTETALGDANPTTTRSKTLADHQVVAKHHTRVEKMAAKVHNQGGVLTIHAYGPDEDLAMARAREVRKHLEAQLEKRGHSGSSPIYVLYAGDPDHKKDTHATVHWHPDVNLPGAMPGAK